MKSPDEIKPECEVKLMKIGTGQAFVIPTWFANQWGLESKKRYRINIIEEIMPFWRLGLPTPACVEA